MAPPYAGVQNGHGFCGTLVTVYIDDFCRQSSVRSERTGLLNKFLSLNCLDSSSSLQQESKQRCITWASQASD
jgi:hypothetical protein